MKNFAKIYLRDLIEKSPRGSLRKSVSIDSRRSSRVSLCATPISRDGSRKSLFSAKKINILGSETIDSPDRKKNSSFCNNSEDGAKQMTWEGTPIDFDMEIETNSESVSPVKTGHKKSKYSEFKRQSVCEVKVEM